MAKELEQVDNKATGKVLANDEVQAGTGWGGGRATEVAAKYITSTISAF